jgi:hypothetical protein
MGKRHTRERRQHDRHADRNTALRCSQKTISSRKDSSKCYPLAMVAVVLIAFALAAAAAPNTDWTVVATMAPGTQVQVSMIGHSKPRIDGTVLRGTPDSLVVSRKSGETSVARTEVKEVKIAAPHKRTRDGLIAVGVGAALGFVIGWAICVYCTNEGHSGYFWQGMGIGAGIGAVGFIPVPYDTIYKAPKK